MGFALSDLQLTSRVFSQGGEIPITHAYDTGNLSPPLQWQNLPKGSKSLAVFCHDPDAPLVSPGGSYGFVHWLIYNIPASATGLEEGCEKYAAGCNDFNGIGYGGPKPPPGHGPHHYYFWLLALDLEPILEPGLQLDAFLQQTEAHVLGMNRLMGSFETR